MNKTKIDWATASWNPITGCLHGCHYCYARAIAHRFTPKEKDNWDDCTQPGNGLHEIRRKNSNGGAWKYGFAPTLHSYRFREPFCTRKPQNVFVGSMADVFGRWVPDDWICRTFLACDDANQHNYIFLTKNPKRLLELYEAGIVPTGKNFWYGTTVTNSADFIPPCRGEELARFRFRSGLNTFLSIEPMLGDITGIALQNLRHFQWVIVGAMSGPGFAEYAPQREWVEKIVDRCIAAGIPVFLKSSLSEIWGEQLIQQYPEILEKNVMEVLRQYAVYS